MPFATKFSQLREPLDDANSEISSITMSPASSSSDRGGNQPVYSRALDQELNLSLREEAEDECGDLFTRAAPTRSRKRFSTLSMASSIAAIVPFISASDKPAVGFTLPHDANGTPNASLAGGDMSPWQGRSRRRLRGSIPQMAALLQRASANAMKEPLPSITSKTVVDWTSSLDSSFDMDSTSSRFTLSFPSSKPAALQPTSSCSRRTPPVSGDAQQPRTAGASGARWKVRPLSTWGRKSMLGNFNASHTTSNENTVDSSAPSLAETSATTASAVSDLSTLNNSATVQTRGSTSATATSSGGRAAGSKRYSRFFRHVDFQDTEEEPMISISSPSALDTAGFEMPMPKERKRSRLRKFFHTLLEQ